MMGHKEGMEKTHVEMPTPNSGAYLGSRPDLLTPTTTTDTAPAPPVPPPDAASSAADSASAPTMGLTADAYEKKMSDYNASVRSAKLIMTTAQVMGMAGLDDMAKPLIGIAQNMVQNDPLKATDQAYALLKSVEGAGGDPAPWLAMFQRADIIRKDSGLMTKVHVSGTDQETGAAVSYNKSLPPGDVPNVGAEKQAHFENINGRENVVTTQNGEYVGKSDIGRAGTPPRPGGGGGGGGGSGGSGVKDQKYLDGLQDKYDGAANHYNELINQRNAGVAVSQKSLDDASRALERRGRELIENPLWVAQHFAEGTSVVPGNDVYNFIVFAFGGRRDLADKFVESTYAKRLKKR